MVTELNEKKARIAHLEEQNGELMAEGMDLKGLINDYERKIKELSQGRSP